MIRHFPTRCEFEGRVCDISLDGVGITVPQPLSPGDLVEVSVRSIRILAEVCHCRAESGWYVAGIHFPYSLQRTELDSMHPDWSNPR